MTLGTIAPLLDSRESRPAGLGSSRPHQLASILDAYQQPDGTWTPVQSLSRSQREALDAAIGNYLETVSPVPDLLELQPEAQSP